MMKWLIVASLVAIVVAQSSPGLLDPVSHEHKIEQHHSLHSPIDKSQVYWNFGGSTVVTKNFIRLSPSTQDHSVKKYHHFSKFIS